MRGGVLAALSLIGALAAAPANGATPCAQTHGPALRDAHWRQAPAPHPLVGQVLAGERPIALAAGACTPSPLEQLIVELWRALGQGGIVLLGEVHDNPEHHRVRKDILWPRLARTASAPERPPAAVFEHIRTDQQPALDAFRARAARSRRLLRAPDLLRALDWQSSGWPEGRIFHPLFDGALQAGMPIVPGDAPQGRVRALARGDLSGLGSEERARISAAEDLPPPLLAALAEELARSHCGALPASALPAMSLAQRYRDAHLADAALAGAERQGAAVLLAGNGHVRADRGVPWHLRRKAPGRLVRSVLLLEAEAGETEAAAYLPRDPNGRPAADYVLFTPRQHRPDPCRRLGQP